ncbi:MAG TPA: hypothetical protein VJI46_06365 [Candidatus Nanoarchaeia archaeon]|nr:hypothetical protein [Candidatus Nanoarchaeia archaeon]
MPSCPHCSTELEITTFTLTEEMKLESFFCGSCGFRASRNVA